MKKNLFVKFVFVFALLLAFSCPAFAAAADAEVKGLWLTSQLFPEDAEVLEFTDDRDMDIVTYVRALSGGELRFEIRRQPIEGSELQSTDDVRNLIEMRVNNEDIGEEALEENFYSIRGTSYAEGVDALSSYSFTEMEYYTGAGDDRRRNVALFIFTNVHCFEVNFSMPANSDYGSFLSDCIVTLTFVGSESDGGDDGAAGGDENTPDAKAADAEVEEMWVTCPGFPADAEVVEFENDKDMGVVTYTRRIDGGTLWLEIRRQPIEGSELQSPEDVKGLIEMRVENETHGESLKENMDGIEVTVNSEELESLYPFPCAAAKYVTGGNEDSRWNSALFIFTDVYCFEVRADISMLDPDFMETYEERLNEWFTGLEFVER